jgi:hypothetical protein
VVPGLGSNLRDTPVRTYTPIYFTHACVHCIGVYLVAEGTVGGFFLLHPAEEDVRDSSVGLLATDLVKAAR